MGLDKKLTMLMNGYGMKKYADIVNEGRATIPQIIQSENYFLTNIDIWIIALYFKIPIVFISQSLLSENGMNMMVLYDNDTTESYFFVHPFTITQGVPSRYGLIEIKVAAAADAKDQSSSDGPVSLLKLPLTAISPELREKIQNNEDARVSLVDYIRAFKLGNIKHKNRVFTMTSGPEPPVAEAATAAATDVRKLASSAKGLSPLFQ
jgi:hypothetical protein